MRRQLFEGETSRVDEENGNIDIQESYDEEDNVLKSEHDSGSEMLTEDVVERVERKLLEANDIGILQPANQNFVLNCFIWENMEQDGVATWISQC